MEIGISHILFFCIIQTLIIIVILLQKRFHQIPNFFLGLIFGLLTAIYVLYLAEFIGYFESPNYIKALRRSLELIPPPFIFIYMLLLLSGDPSFKKTYLGYFIVPGVGLGIFLLMVLSNFIFSIPQSVNDLVYMLYMTAGALTAGVLFYAFGYNIVLLIRSKTREYKSLIKCLFYVKEKRFRWARLVALLYYVHGTIFIIECFYFIAHPTSNIPSLINTIFYISLGYVLIINLIQNPTIIHFSNKTAGNLVLKKYEKTGLSNAEAKVIMKKLNNYMESEKPYLNSHLSSQDLSEKLAIPIHAISEVTNGLMGQNFFDYVNNYRIEEFKKLAKQSKKANIKIIHLAYESGFSSKASFNLAFKKFTGITPSQYIKDFHSN